MTDKNKLQLKISQKLDILSTIVNRQPLKPVLDSLSTKQLVEAHSFLWDKLVEIHYLTQTGEFSRKAVTQRMTPSAVYQRQQGCDLRLDYCKGVECIWSNPVCAGTKVKNNMAAMAEAICEYLSQDSEVGKKPVDYEARGDYKVWI